MLIIISFNSCVRLRVVNQNQNHRVFFVLGRQFVFGVEWAEMGPSTQSGIYHTQHTLFFLFHPESNFGNYSNFMPSLFSLTNNHNENYKTDDGLNCIHTIKRPAPSLHPF
jgi:hypothetical protein